MRNKAILALEDGTIFKGYSVGAEGETFGEVVFNTSMTGYQEILTDPSYAGQIVTMTYPLIGNYGVNSQDYESRGPFLEGFVVREYSRFFSSWRAKGSLEDFLKNFGIVCIEGVDTRALTKHIRSAGAMRGVISTNDQNVDSLVEKINYFPSLVGRDLVKEVTIDDSYTWETKPGAKYRVVAFDFGIKRNILKCLESVNCKVEVVPASTSADDILALDPHGIFLSNGPGDPKGVSYAIQTVRNLIGKKPIFGICLGHQLLALALGADTYKLKFGHRGANHPVKNLASDKIEITSQNHGFAVNGNSFKDKKGKIFSDFGEIEITHINLNDDTVEGLRCLELPAFSVQYHPEASPGPHDSKYLFKDFVNMMEEFTEGKK
ncbi:MAG TPA: carbamoyl-phosphate synthase small subunit [Actinobacteria bacterium]|nr:carbamoyl-phosphate synthase small subunit [Actinomycetota bacterium]